MTGAGQTIGVVAVGFTDVGFTGDEPLLQWIDDVVRFETSGCSHVELNKRVNLDIILYTQHN